MSRLVPAPAASLTVGEIVLPSAPLGDPNPLPPLAGASDLHRDVVAPDVDDELRAGLGYGRVETVLPYLLQDGYGRRLSPSPHPVAVLEDERMRAEFLLDLGGRLRSLIDKRTGRELLHRNESFQPAHLALRNGWFAGGVEWNLGTTGHWPLTCSPLHAVRVRRSDGVPVLRMYEYERMRGLVVRIDASLAPDAPALVVSITIRNPRDVEVPVYWWSNAAVPEGDDVRVLAPADSAYRFGYEGELARVPFPVAHEDGVDRSYPARSPDATDWFFELGSTATPWIAALDGEGTGLVQASSARLRGRKLFVWGTNPGGAHWQRWLDGGSDRRYLEIQAGLLRTQLEHTPMPAGESWRWTEVYALAEADDRAVHGPWVDAVAATSDALEQTGVPMVLSRETARDDSDDEVVEVLRRASGWGALEEARRVADGEAPLSSSATPFPVSDLGPEQAWWRDDAPTDADRADPGSAPLSYQADSVWLARVIARDGWLARLQEGVLLVAQGRWAEAVVAWRASIAARDTGWAWRNLAVAATREGDADAAAAAYERARQLLPGLLPLTVEAVGQLLSSGRAREVLAIIGSLDPATRGDGRIRYAEARAALAVGELARCGRLLDEGIEIADLKEGETSLDGLWVDYHVTRIADAEGIEVTTALRERVLREIPPPEAYDFRMH